MPRCPKCGCGSYLPAAADPTRQPLRCLACGEDILPVYAALKGARTPSMWRFILWIAAVGAAATLLGVALLVFVNR